MATKKTTLKIRQFRANANMSLNELSRISGLSLDYIWQIEMGLKTNVGVDKLRALAKALKVDLHDIIC